MLYSVWWIWIIEFLLYCYALRSPLLCFLVQLISRQWDESVVDWKIFTLKTIRVTIFRGVKFLRFCPIHEIFVTVDSYNMDYLIS